MRIILIDKLKRMCYDLGVNKNDSQIQESEVLMETSTKQFRKRNAILECLMNTDTHPSAEMVYQMLQKTHPDISQATVYRNLALFRKQGLIVSVGTVNGAERFDANTASHVHFFCTGCDSVLDLPQIEVPSSIGAEAEKLSGCRVNSCHLTMTGLCGDCQTGN